MKKKIGIISFSEIEKDSRVKRQLSALEDKYEIFFFGYGKSISKKINHFSLKEKNNYFYKVFYCLLLLCKRFKLYTSIRFNYTQIMRIIERNNIEVLILNDSTSWPILGFFKSPQYCVIDAHEYTPEELTDNILWEIFYKEYKLWCSKFVKYGGVHFCVEKNLCKKWTKFSGKEFIELRNSSNYFNIPKDKRKIFKSDSLKYIHHGLATPSRKIENMIFATKKAGKKYRGNFFLTGKNREYINYLKEIGHKNHCEIFDPINEDQLILKGTKYDFALISIFPNNTNYKYCLPNKFFQFIQSRLPIISGPTPSISFLIKKYNIGIVAESFSPKDLGEAMKKLNYKNINLFKTNCDFAAKELCWDIDKKILTDKIKRLIKD